MRFFIHNSENCEIFRRSYELNYILKFIPNARVLISKNMLRDFGKNLYLSFKNSLIIDLSMGYEDKNAGSLSDIGNG